MAEQLVVDYEHTWLREQGRSDLADRVRWTAREDGDGLGYDVLSYSIDGHERYIEVKTTALGALTPFYLSSAELEFARCHPQTYALYRVYAVLATPPRFFALPAGSDRSAVRAAVESGYQHEDYAQRLALVTEYYAFLTGMKTEDLVVTVADNRLRVGAIAGEPQYCEDEDTRLRRAVAWSTQAVALSELPSSVAGLLDQQGTVVDVTAGLEEFRKYILKQDDLDGDGSVELDRVPRLPAVTDEVAVAMFMPRPALQEIVDLLQVRQQIVLYGPPGTGKTYLARMLSEHLVGSDDSSRARLVQFHPSYAYEDFFEGYRPAESGSGQPTFSLQPGPLRELAGEARKQENSGSPFVLVIDEMNRANIAKVFGELYFLLEYRDEAIRLQYQPGEAFRLPRNLFIIATMNTADRSIALVDAAIRRRFAFVEMHPDEPPVKDVLAGGLARIRPRKPRTHRAARQQHRYQHRRVPPRPKRRTTSPSSPGRHAHPPRLEPNGTNSARANLT